MQGTMDHSRRRLPPLTPHKRKARDETFDFLKPSRTTRPTPPPPRQPPRPPPKLANSKSVTIPRPTAATKPPKAAVSSPAPAPANNNILLAGYLANEYLHKGTLFGQLYDPAPPPPPPAACSAGSMTMRQPGSGSVNREKGKAVDEVPPKPKRIHEPQLVKIQRYAAVSQLIKDGVHIPGIVNPLELARFLHL